MLGAEVLIKTSNPVDYKQDGCQTQNCNGVPVNITSLENLAFESCDD